MSLDYAAIAKCVELFRGVSPEDVAKIFAKGMTMQTPKGNTIFYKGTTGNTMFVILAGTVELYDGRKLLATLRTGDMFGEMALISNEPRSASAVAAENTSLFVLSEDVFRRLMTKQVAIRILLNIISTLAHRLREANKRLPPERDQETYA